MTSTPATPTEASWRIEVREEERLVVVTTSGLFTLAAFQQMVPAALSAGTERGFDRFVFDDRLMRPKLATSEIYKLPELFERLGWRRGMRVAVVISTKHRSADDHKFFANLAIARAFQYRLFEELEHAVAWAAETE